MSETDEPDGLQEAAPSARWPWLYLSYCALHLVLSPLLALRSAARAKRRDYARSWWLRLTGGSRPPRSDSWTVFLAPHIGEAKVAARLARSVAELGEASTVVLATVDSAVEAVRKIIPAGAAPFNNPISCLLFLRRWHPRVLVAIGSCDIAHLTALCALTRVPMVVLDTALTESQADGIAKSAMRRWRWQTAALWAVPTDEVKARLMRLGVPPERVWVTGPLGTWPECKMADDATRRAHRSRLNLSPQDGPIVLAGSTHAEDVEVLLPAFALLRSSEPNAVLVLAPRRPDRISTLLQRLAEADASYKLRSAEQAPLPAGRVIVLDTYGELEHLYAVADVAYVGGTFSPARGGHTPAEALAWGVPVTMGPHYDQQRAAMEPLIADGVARPASNERELARAWEDLLEEKNVRERVRSAYDRIRSPERQTLAVVWQLVSEIVTSCSRGSPTAENVSQSARDHSLR